MNVMVSKDDLETDRETSARLAKQKQKNTKPEVYVRSLIHRLGHRFRIGNRDLPGSPDIANRSKGWAVFVHGCYWHHHQGCSRATIPKRNREFWVAKFKANRERDARVVRELQDEGFDVLTIWECELGEPEQIVDRLSEFLPG